MICVCRCRVSLWLRLSTLIELDDLQKWSSGWSVKHSWWSNPLWGHAFLNYGSHCVVPLYCVKTATPKIVKRYVAIRPITVCTKTQTCHVSKGSDHVLSTYIHLLSKDTGLQTEELVTAMTKHHEWRDACFHDLRDTHEVKSMKSIIMILLVIWQFYLKVIGGDVLPL